MSAMELTASEISGSCRIVHHLSSSGNLKSTAKPCVMSVYANPHQFGVDGDSSFDPVVLDPIRRNPSREALSLVGCIRLSVDGDSPNGLLADHVEKLPRHHGVWQPECLEWIRPTLEFTQDTENLLLRSLLRINPDDRVGPFAFGSSPGNE